MKNSECRSSFLAQGAAWLLLALGLAAVAGVFGLGALGCAFIGAEPGGAELPIG